MRQINDLSAGQLLLGSNDDDDDHVMDIIVKSMQTIRY